MDRPLTERLWNVVRHCWDLGLIAFGGPPVHLILLKARFVDKLKWLDEKTYLDLFSLSGALPGPASTKVALSIAVVTQGLIPGLLQFIFWSLPGAIGMAVLGVGVSRIPDVLPPIVMSLLTGLNAAAVGLIALAAVQLGTAASTDEMTTTIVWLSASFGVCYHHPAMYPSLIAAGGMATLLWDFRRRLFVAPAKKIFGKGQPREEDVAGQMGRERGEEMEMTTVVTAPMAVEADPRGGEEVEKDITAVRPHFYPSPAPSPPSSPQLAPRSSRSLHTDDIEPAVNPSSSSVRSRRTNTNLIQQQSSSQGEEGEPTAVPQQSPLQTVPVRAALTLFAAFCLLLIIPLSTRAGLKNAGRTVPRALDFFSNMVIAGTIIFGGGPVVIPLLRDYVVGPGWVSSRDFLLTFAILQAFPGPNFNFAVALGILSVPNNRVLGAFAGWAGIFSPGLSIHLALIPFYANWRNKPYVRATIRGLNAAAAGLIFVAVWQLFLVGYIYRSPEGGDNPSAPQTLSGPLTADPFWGVVASGAFVGCKTYKMPPWLAIALGACAGMAWYGVTK